MARINSKIDGTDVLGVVSAGETLYMARATHTQFGIVKPSIKDFVFDKDSAELLVRLGIGLKHTDDGIALAIYDGNYVTDVVSTDDGLLIKYTDIDDGTASEKIIPWTELNEAQFNALKDYALNHDLTELDFPNGEFTDVQYNTVNGIALTGTAKTKYKDNSDGETTIAFDIPLAPADNTVAIDRATTPEIKKVLIKATKGVKAVTKTANGGLECTLSDDTKLQTGPFVTIAQADGNSEEQVMSQKAVTDALVKKLGTPYGVDFPHGAGTVTYDTTDGMHIRGTMRIYTSTDKTTFIDVPNTEVEIPIKAGTGISIDKAASGEFVEIKNTTPYGVDFPHGEPTSVTYDTTDGMVVTGTMRVYTAEDKSSYYDVENVSVEIPLVAGDNVSIDADNTNKKVVIKSTGGVGVDIGVGLPSSTTQGILTVAQLALLQSDESNYIMFQHEKYYLEDKGHVEGYITYTHTGYENSTYWIKSITITLSTRAWVLNKGGLAGNGLEFGTDDKLRAKLGTNLSFGTNGEINAEGGTLDADTLYPLVKSGSTENFTISKSGGKVNFAIQGGPVFDALENKEYLYLDEVYYPKGNEEQPSTDSTRSVIISNSHVHDLIFRFTYGSVESISIKDLKPPTYYRHVVRFYSSSSSGIIDFRVVIVSSKSTPIDSLTDVFTALSAYADTGYPASGYYRQMLYGPVINIYPKAGGDIEYLTVDGSSDQPKTWMWSDWSFTITDTVAAIQ